MLGQTWKTWKLWCLEDPTPQMSHSWASLWCFLVRMCCTIFLSGNEYHWHVSSSFECFHKPTLMWVAAWVRELTVPARPPPLSAYLCVFTLLAFLMETSPKSPLSRLGFQTTMLFWQQQEIHVSIHVRLVVNVRGYQNHCKANVVLNDIPLDERDYVRVKSDWPIN